MYGGLYAGEGRLYESVKHGWIGKTLCRVRSLVSRWEQPGLIEAIIGKGKACGYGLCMGGIGIHSSQPNRLLWLTSLDAVSHQDQVGTVLDSYIRPLVMRHCVRVQQQRLELGFVGLFRKLFRYLGLPTVR